MICRVPSLLPPPRVPHWRFRLVDPRLLLPPSPLLEIAQWGPRAPGESLLRDTANHSH